MTFDQAQQDELDRLSEVFRRQQVGLVALKDFRVFKLGKEAKDHILITVQISAAKISSSHYDLSIDI